MISKWKSGWKYLHYAHGRISNTIAMAIFFVIGIFFLTMATIADIPGITFIGGFMAMASAIMPTQMLYSLSVSNLVQASPAKKKLQTSVPALITCVNMMVIYLIIILNQGIFMTLHPERMAIICIETLLLAVTSVVLMIYMALAYKYFAVSVVMFMLIYFMLYYSSSIAEYYTNNLQLSLFPAFPLTILIGIILIAVGGFLQYLISLSIYKVPMSKMAQVASLRKVM